MERADHQAGADQKDERERDLNDHEDVASAKLFAAGTECAAAFADASAEAHAGVLEDRDTGEEPAGDQSHDQGEEQDGAVDADFVNARKIFGRDRNEEAKADARRAPGRQRFR